MKQIVAAILTVTRSGFISTLIVVGRSNAPKMAFEVELSWGQSSCVGRGPGNARTGSQVHLRRGVLLEMMGRQGQAGRRRKLCAR
jgi:hypothetical protein